MRTTPLEAATLQGDELIHTPIGDIELRHSYFDDDASRRLFDEMDFQRACQAYIWSQPIVSLTTWRLRGATAGRERRQRHEGSQGRGSGKKTTDPVRAHGHLQELGGAFSE